MDYNYVRMRNAMSKGDEALAKYYKEQCDKGIEPNSKKIVLGYILTALVTVSVILGGYIAYTELVYTDNSDHVDISEVIE